MWPVPSLSDNIVTIDNRAHNLVLSWLSPSGSSITLKAYQRTTTTQIHPSATVFNTTQLKTTIARFLQEYNLGDASIIMCLSGQGVSESLIKLATASPTPADMLTPALRKMVWDYQYIYPADHAAYVFYVAGIIRPIILQYQLLAINLSLNLRALTTPFMASLFLYKNLYGSAFRHTQLAHDMHQTNNQLLSLFSTDVLRRSITIPAEHTLNLEEEKFWLLTSLGLYYGVKKGL